MTDDRARMWRLGLWLEYGTIGWNVVEAGLTIGLGIAAGSLALIGFGADSIIEVFASSVIVWHLRPGHEEDSPERTSLALRIVGYAFAALALALATFAIRDLVTGRQPDESVWGAIYLVSAAVVMSALGWLKHRVARRIDSAPLASEATLTVLDGFLAAGTAVGLGLNILFGWWWADPLTALVVAVICVSEARENLEESREWAEG